MIRETTLTNKFKLVRKMLEYYPHDPVKKTAHKDD